jgi:hypothetical protein
MKTLKIAGLLLACMLAGAIGPSLMQVAYQGWQALPPTEHDQWLAQQDWAHRVDVAFAANPLACGTGSCGTVEPWNTSTINPINFFADHTSGTGVNVSNAATGTLNATTHPEIGLSNTNTSAVANGCPDTGTGSTNSDFQVSNSANTAHNFNVLCNGSVSIASAASPALNVTGSITTSSTINSPSITLSSASTVETYSGTSGATISSAATSGPAIIWQLSAGITPASTLNYQFNGGTAGTTPLLTVAGNGNLVSPIGNYTNTAGNVVDTAGNFIANGTANATGELISGNGTAVTGAKGVGAIVANGPYYQFTNCVQTTSVASPTSLLTLPAGSWGCKLTSGSATATTFTITYPGSVTLTNAPLCVFTDRASGITTEPTCTPGTTSVSIVYAVAPGAVSIGDLLIIGNGI